MTRNTHYSSSKRTRNQLIATAEELFAERGIDNVSMNDINQAAKQKNRAAVHYHFGNKHGLLQAIIDKHLPGLVEQREQLLAQSADQHDIRSIVHAMVKPLTDKLSDPDGGRAFISINAQLAANHASMVNRLPGEHFYIGENDTLTEAREKLLGHMPEDIANQRVMLAMVLMLHGLANFGTDASLFDSPQGAERFHQNLEDTLVAVYTAPYNG